MKYIIYIYSNISIKSKINLDYIYKRYSKIDQLLGDILSISVRVFQVFLMQSNNYPFFSSMISTNQERGL